MGTLTIASGGVFPAHLTNEAKSVLTGGARVVLQTAKSYFPSLLGECGVAYECVDDLFENAEDFDALNEAVAKRLCVYAREGDVVYAALGSAAGQAIARVLRREADALEITLSILPGIGCGDVAFAAVAGREGFSGIPRQLFASDLVEHPPRLDASMPLVVQELNSAMLASSVKLALLDYYPADQPMVLALAKQDRYELVEIPLHALDRQTELTHTSCALLPALVFDQLERMGVEQLEWIMDKLRGPGGCPWDREQTHESLKICLLEEAYEVIEAIDLANDDKLCEELGDLLLQIAFHVCIAKEQARFTMRDVATGICQKLVFRHPHIFSTAKADTAQDVLRNWEQLKKKEKKLGTQTDVLRAVPKPLPALTRSAKIQAKAAQVGFDWNNAADAFLKVREEVEELYAEMNRQPVEEAALEEELGDLLFAVVNVARLLHILPEFALQKSGEKFVERFAVMEQRAFAQGKKLEGMTLEEMDKIWNEIKHLPRG